MMLFPYMSEPATGSRIPSMSTGGAAMNATMKQMVAANRVGIISTPNQPTYRRLLVEVTQSQKLSQVDAPCWRDRVEAIVLNKKVRPSGKWWSYYSSTPLSRGMKDCCFTTLFSLGKAWVCYETKTVRYICLPIYGNTVRKTRQPLKDECLYSISRTALPNLGYYNTVQPPTV